MKKKSFIYFYSILSRSKFFNFKFNITITFFTLSKDYILSIGKSLSNIDWNETKKKNPQ